MSETTFHVVPVDDVLPNPDNPRRSRTKGASIDMDLAPLVESIRVHGVIEPIVCQPSGSAVAPHQIIAGERRWRAAQKAGLEEVPILLRTDGENAQAIAVVENMQRKPLDPLQEARAIEGLLLADPEKTLADVAAELGMAESVVARRRQLAQLAPAVLKKRLEADSEVSRWSLRMLELLASYGRATQEEAVRYNGVASMRDLKSELARLEHRLDAAPWDLEDERLVRSAGSCAACPKRSDQNAVLFADLETDEAVACLDVGCWKKKAAAHLRAQEKAHPEAKKITGDWNQQWDDAGHKRTDVTYRQDHRQIRAKRKAKTDLEVLDIGTGQHGFLPKGGSSGSSRPKKKKTPAPPLAEQSSEQIGEAIERAELLLDRKRIRQAVRELLELEVEQPDDVTLLNLAALVGGGSRCTFRGSSTTCLATQTGTKLKAFGGRPLKGSALYRHLDARNSGHLKADLWAHILGTLRRRLNVEESFDDHPQIKAEAAGYAALVGADWPAIWVQAENDHPPSKALLQKKEAKKLARKREREEAA